MYILKEDIKNIDELVRWLENHMITRSEYSCKKQKMCAIAIHFGRPHPHGTNTYIFCSDRMCSCDPKISWLCCRKRYGDEEEFKVDIQTKLNKIYDVRLRETLSKDMM